MKEPNLRPAFILAGAGMLYVGNELITGNRAVKGSECNPVY